jgi:uncharacterized repeat protein (TIGR03803 family)
MKKLLLFLSMAICGIANAQFTTLYNFAGAPTDGNSPRGSLISDGTSLYGMTAGGGSAGYGTIFKIMPDGTGYNKLLDFDNTNGIMRMVHFITMEPFSMG